MPPQRAQPPAAPLGGGARRRQRQRYDQLIKEGVWRTALGGGGVASHDVIVEIRVGAQPAEQSQKPQLAGVQLLGMPSTAPDVILSCYTVT